MSLVPNSTQVPNIFIDEVMSQVSGTAFKILMLITRNTMGWIVDPDTKRRKEKDWISYNQIREKSGASLQTISNALKELKGLDLIVATDAEGQVLQTSEEKRGQRIFYRINTESVTSLKTRDVCENLSKNQSLETRDTKEIHTKEDVSKLTSDGIGVEVKEFGNESVNRILKEFSELTGLSRPADRNYRNWAHTFCRTKSMGVEKFAPCLKFLLGKKLNITKIETVFRQFPTFERDMLGKTVIAIPRTEEEKAFNSYLQKEDKRGYI